MKSTTTRTGSFTAVRLNVSKVRQWIAAAASDFPVAQPRIEITANVGATRYTFVSVDELEQQSPNLPSRLSQVSIDLSPSTRSTNHTISLAVAPASMNLKVSSSSATFAYGKYFQLQTWLLAEKFRWAWVAGVFRWVMLLTALWSLWQFVTAGSVHDAWGWLVVCLVALVLIIFSPLYYYLAGCWIAPRDVAEYDRLVAVATLVVTIGLLIVGLIELGLKVLGGQK